MAEKSKPPALRVVGDSHESDIQHGYSGDVAILKQPAVFGWLGRPAQGDLAKQTQTVFFT